MSVAQRSEEWFKQRVGIITGSRVGAILGLNPYSSRDDVMREMVREYHGAEKEFTGNTATEWGVEHEDTAISEYEDLTGRFVESTGFHLSPGLGWLGASPDGLTGNDGLVEVKCPYSQKIKPISEQPHYFAQVQLQLLVTDREWCDFVSWTPDNIEVERVFYDAGWASEHLPTLEEFYNDYLNAIEEKDSVHLQPLELDMSEDAAWITAENHYLAAVEAESAAKTDKEIWKKQLIELSGEKKSKGKKLQIFPVIRDGAISYSKAVKDLLPDADLSKYKGKPSISFTVKEVKQ